MNVCRTLCWCREDALLVGEDFLSGLESRGVSGLELAVGLGAGHWGKRIGLME